MSRPREFISSPIASQQDNVRWIFGASEFRCTRLVRLRPAAGQKQMATKMQSLTKLLQRGASRLRRSRPDAGALEAATVQNKPAVQNIPTTPIFVDHYPDWLSWANAGMLYRGNLCSFDYAIKNLKDEAAIVEVGSFCGLSANFLNYYKRINGRSNALFTCDPWVFPGAAPGELLGRYAAVRHDEYREFVRETFLRNVRFFSRGNLPHTIEASSVDFFASWRRREKAMDVFGREVTLGGRIGFVYIDGDHCYAAAKLDFQLADEFLEEDGFVLFDDSGDASGCEVIRVIEEVKATGRYEVVIANPNYLFRKLRGIG
jgi:hypothetical protein